MTSRSRFFPAGCASILALLLAGGAAMAARAEPPAVTSGWHEWTDAAGRPARAYVARRVELAGGAPGVVVVIDASASASFARARADGLARLGWVALALEFTGEESPPGRGELLRRTIEALGALRRMSEVDGARLAVVGFGLGGAAALDLARGGGEGVAGVVAFHAPLRAEGGAKSPAEIKPRLLVLHGATDPAVPPPDVAEFLDAMNAARARFRFVALGLVGSAFTRPGRVEGREPAETTAAAYAEMRRFLEEVFARPEKP